MGGSTGERGQRFGQVAIGFLRDSDMDLPRHAWTQKILPEGPTLTTFLFLLLFDDAREDQITIISGPSSARQRNAT